jgi:hypothetical protein
MQPGDECVQQATFWRPGSLASWHEDCLYLNVYAPAAEAGAKRPVLIWFHGGGWVNGAGTDVQPTWLIAEGNVVVTVNYRLGALGYLALPALDAESADKQSSGQYGDLDKVEALRWVQRNIGAFGGDPERVTIAGQSAGAGSVCWLMASPSAKRLFQRAVIQSIGDCANIDHNEATQRGARFAQAAGCGDATDVAACLRSKSPPQIIDAQIATGIPWRPVQGGSAQPSLSRDSLFDQRTDVSLSVQGDNRGVNGPVEVVGVGEGLVGEMVGFEIAPDGFDVVEFGRVLGQPFDGEPMGAGGKRGDAGLAHVDRAVVEHDDDWPDRQAWPRAIKAVEPPQQRNEIGAALGFAGMHDEPASGVVERPDHCHLLGLAGRRHTQIGATLSPGSGQVRMRQRLALVGEQEHDIAGLRLRLAQRQPEADAIDGVGVLAALQSVSRPTPAEFFFRSTLDRRDLEMVTPSRASISPMRRASVQLRRSATGASSNGATTLSAASALTGAGPDAGLVSSASTPPRAKSLRHSRTVSSRTPNASAMRGLVQPDSVSNKARARSASPRSRETASLRNPAFCSSPAATGDLPAMSHPRESTRKRNHSRHPLASQMKPA